MKILHELWEHKFVGATGIAALVHSTWSLGTLFGGEQPQGGWQLVGWLATAFLIAFSLDVGQISTSMEIKARGMTRARGLTFFVFAVSTYYLQWLYMAHHMPALATALGIRAEWQPLVLLLRDAAIWIVPAFLPLATVLYTFSGGKDERVTEVPIATPATIQIDAPPTIEMPILPPEVSPEPLPFGDVHRIPDGLVSIHPPPPSRKRTVTASANGTAKHALRNKADE